MADGKSGVLAQLVEELNAKRIRVVIAAPLKIADGSGSPLRVIALAPA